MASVLIAALDGNLGYVLENELADDGHRVGRLPPGAELTAYIADHPAYDIVLLDILTSCLSDMITLKLLRTKCPHIHIIVFADRVAPQERASLLDSGADMSFMKHELNGLKEHLRRNFSGADR